MSAIWSRSGVKRKRAREAARRVKLRQHRFWIDTGPGLAPKFGSGSIHPPPAPIGDGERIIFNPPLAIGERVGKAGLDLFRSLMKRCSHARLPRCEGYGARCAMP
jgi:hypothetical protein